DANVTIGAANNYDVVMQPDAQQLEDVVVTALGIKREKKALGYAVQDVKSDELTKGGDGNVVSALSGKVAGAQIITSSGQVGASSTIKIRGNKSFGGTSQPLFVVDGTPIMNGNSSAIASASATDFGNAAMDIDPENIESISILKGASAAALYGSRASNGVILITTKKGKKSKGLGVNFNSSIAFDEVYILPNYQNEYGQGGNASEYYWKNWRDGHYYGDGELADYQDFADYRFHWSPEGDGNGEDYDESWGPRLDAGLKLVQFDSPTAKGGELDPFGNPYEAGDLMHSDWISRPNNVKDFYETGVTFSNNVSITGGNDMASGRFTISHVDQKGTSPNTDQSKLSIGVNGNMKLSDKLKVGTSFTYAKIKNDNLPQTGNSMRNPLVEFNGWFGRQVNVDYLKDHYQDWMTNYKTGERPFNWMWYYNNQHNNPYWTANVNTMKRDRNRVYGNVFATLSLLDGVDLTARVGTDFFNEERKYDFHRGSQSWNTPYMNATNGTFWNQFRLESETNADLFLTIDKKLSEKITLASTLGANYRYAFDRFNTVTGNDLVKPDFFSTSNIAGTPSVDFTRYEKKSQSVFGSANIGYDNFVFLDLTLRGDWSSTLPKENWNYWYPSANLGFIFTDAFNINSDLFNYGKVRAGYAIVGNDTSPYRLNSFYSRSGSTFNSIDMYRLSSTIYSKELRPEQTNSFETGLEMKFFGNRLGLDVTYYKTNTKDLLMTVDVAQSSGYTGWMKNAGEIENKGIELQTYFTAIEKEDFSWDINLNWSKNTNKVVSLEDGMEELIIASFDSGRGIQLKAVPGENWGTIYGKTIKRDDDGNALLYATSSWRWDDYYLPQQSDDVEVIGDVNPDFVGGLRNTFNYKGISLSVLVDFRKGGDIFSMTKFIGQKSGILQNTVDGGIREDGMIVPGLIEQEDGSFIENTTITPAQRYFAASRNWAELSIVDGSFIKLREISLAYQLPTSLVSKIGLQSASVSAFGRNLALLYTHSSNDVNIDPEVSTGGSIGGTGFESYQLAPSRTIGFKLNVNF
ncbi:MAG: SusC/RagA family TonB-linked outer membrane protein, partial [Bacteroidota bacterium]